MFNDLKASLGWNFCFGLILDFHWKTERKKMPLAPKTPKGSCAETSKKDFRRWNLEIGNQIISNLLNFHFSWVNKHDYKLINCSMDYFVYLENGSRRMFISLHAYGKPFTRDHRIMSVRITESIQRLLKRKMSHGLTKSGAVSQLMTLSTSLYFSFTVGIT